MHDPLETVEYSWPGTESKLVQREASGGTTGLQPRRLGPFDLVRPIGSGGMSLVFEAIDTRNGQGLALKMLYTQGLTAMQRLKREFRALADIHHRNLVQLHELFVDGEQPFFTMELIYGVSLLEYLRVDGAPVHSRIEPTLRQLVDAVSTLHAGGILHRDLKPSNILVQPDGRVVVLDFGLAHSLAEPSSGLGSGTPAYMAPERLLGDVSSEPSDWYSVGVILWEVLTGELPGASASTHSFSPGLPKVASDIARDLLAPGSSRRPSGSQLRALFSLPPTPDASALAQLPATTGLLVGREPEHAWLHDAYAQARLGQVVVAQLHGEPGIGKTALVKDFLRTLKHSQEDLVLESRCYEHERIPYNAVDGVIDGLAQHLDRVRRCGEPLPAVDGAAELAKLFPTLASSLNGQPPPGPQPLPVDDPQRLRQRAIAALCALLHAISAKQTIVIHVDDLQWGDADSAQLLSQLIESSASVRLLVIASYRTAEAEGGVCVRGLRCLSDKCVRRERSLGVLHEDTALMLARELATDELTDSELRLLATESRGSPLF